MMLKLRHLKADVYALPYHVDVIAKCAENLDYSYGDPNDLWQLDEYIEKFREAEQGLLKIAHRLEGRR